MNTRYETCKRARSQLIDPASKANSFKAGARVYRNFTAPLKAVVFP